MESKLSLRDMQIRRTVGEMFVQRGYVDVEKGEEFVMAVKPCGAEVCAFVVVFSKFDMDDFRGCVARLRGMGEGGEGVSHAVVIFDDITPAAKNLLAKTVDLRLAAGNDRLQVESFYARELRYNLTTHRLYVPHEKVPDEEAVRIMDNYQVIKASDPVVRFFGWKRGSLIKIVRSTGMVAYRVVRK